MLHTEIWSDHHPVFLTWRIRVNWDRLNPEEMWQRFQDASRNLHLPEKLCSSAPRAKAALNSKDAHNNCWLNSVNRSELIKKIYLWHNFLIASSLYISVKLLTVPHLCRFLEESWRRCHSSSGFSLSFSVIKQYTHLWNSNINALNNISLYNIIYLYKKYK